MQEVPKIERLKILREKEHRQLEILKRNQDTIEALRKNMIEVWRRVQLQETFLATDIE